MIRRDSLEVDKSLHPFVRDGDEGLGDKNFVVGVCFPIRTSPVH